MVALLIRVFGLSEVDCIHGLHSSSTDFVYCLLYE